MHFKLFFIIFFYEICIDFLTRIISTVKSTEFFTFNKKENFNGSVTSENCRIGLSNSIIHALECHNFLLYH